MTLLSQLGPKQQRHMLRLPVRQRGLSFFGWLLTIMVLGSVITVGLKLIPPYIDHHKMSGVLDSMAEESGMANKRRYELEDMINKRFRVNNIRDFNHKDNLQVKRGKSGVEVILDYEVRVPLFYNLDLIARFDKSVSFKNQ